MVDVVSWGSSRFLNEIVVFSLPCRFPIDIFFLIFSLQNDVFSSWSRLPETICSAVVFSSFVTILWPTWDCFLLFFAKADMGFLLTSAHPAPFHWFAGNLMTSRILKTHNSIFNIIHLSKFYQCIVCNRLY